MRIFILLTIASLSLFSCNRQTFPTEVSTPNTSVPTSNVVSTASSASKETEVLPTIFRSSTPYKTEVLPTIFPSYTPYATEVVPTVMQSSFPAGVFFFGVTPPTNHIGGISGVFYSQSVPDEMCPWIYDILRFYEDGLVMDVPACENAANDVFDKVWPATSQWLNRENDDPTMSRGTYYIGENQIWFTTTAENNTVVVDYFGTISEDRLILDSYSHYNGHQTTAQEFIFFPTSGRP